MSDTETKKKGSVPIAVHQESIVVAQNKNLELFVKNFSYESENITGKHLGKIFGFFEIPEITDENAYIVNFLASVVKKEYFQNPRRSANESFEAALHKINLALTELVKQGNTAWLGSLQGAIAVIEEDTLHFSVTGDAAIILYRNEESITISDGLADKDAAEHPLKTFLEISSGKLLPNDTLLFTSPELFTLCSEDMLLKNVLRMTSEAFTRYLRAALVNELPLATSTILTIQKESTPKSTPKKASLLEEESRLKLQNVFSGKSFKEDLKPSPMPAKEPVEETLLTDDEEELLEYIDSKTGHIYVQGEQLDALPSGESRFSSLQEHIFIPLTLSIQRFSKRWSRKSKKVLVQKTRKFGQASQSFLVIITRQIKKSLRQTKRTLATVYSVKKSSIAAWQEKRKTEKSLSLNENSPSAPLQSTETDITHVSEEDSTVSVALPSFEPIVSPSDSPSPSSRLAAFTENSQRNTPLATTSFFSTLESWGERAFAGMTSLWKTLKGLPRPVLAGGILLLVGGIAIIILLSTDTPSPQSNANDIQKGPSISSLTPENSTDTAPQSTSLREILSTNEEPVALITTEDTPYLILSSSLKTPTDTYSQADMGNFIAAAYMADLRLIFLWTDKNTLVSFSTVDKKWATNTLPLPAGAKVSSLGSYLTYLYTFDQSSGQLYRFARTEGGFGEPKNWFKSPSEGIQGIAVGDSVRTTNRTGVTQFTQGIKEKELSQDSFTLLVNSSEQNFTLGVETKTGKLAIWDTDGNTKMTTTLKETVATEHIGYNEKNKELLLVKENKLVALPLSW